MTIQYYDLLPSMQAIPDDCDDVQDQPYRECPNGYRRAGLDPAPGYREVTREEWESRSGSAHTRQEPRAARRRSVAAPGRFLRRRRADQAGGRRCRCWSRRRCSTRCARPRPDLAGLYADPVRRYMLPAALATGAPTGPAIPRHARQPARGGDVDGGGAHPPLPHQGAGGDARHLPAVLRPLHPHGPGRATRRRRCKKHKFDAASRPTGTSRCSTTCARRPACATWWSRAATSPTCPCRSWRRSSPRCWTSPTSATSAWPARG